MTDDLEARLIEALKLRARIDPADVGHLLETMTLPARQRSSRTAWRVAAAVVVGVVALGGLAIGLSGGRFGASPSMAPVTTTVDDGTFRLTMTADHGTYEAGEAIGIMASLTYLGPDASIDARGARSGIVTLGVQRDGDRMIGGSGGRLSCVTYPMVRGRTVQLVPAKIVGFSADDPNADFLRAYAADPLLHLPAGTWHLHAFLAASVGDCGAPDHALDAAVTVTVSGPANPSPEPASPSPLTPVGSPTALPPEVGTVDDGTYRLALTVERPQADAPGAIDVRAALTYLGPGPTVDTRGGDPLVVFMIQRDGDQPIGGVQSTVCFEYPMTAGQAVDYPLASSFGFPASDPQGGLDPRYVTDPLPHLMPGTWHIHAQFGGYVGSCGGELHGLDAVVTIVVPG